MLYTWQMIIFICWNFPSIILYIFILFQLVFKAGFNSSFFRLSIFMGVVDLLNHITIWFYFKLILYPFTSPIYFLISKENFIFIFMSFLSYYFMRCRELLLLSTAFNRFTAICFPHKQTKIWDKFLIPIIAFCFIFPFLTTFQNFFGKTTIMPFSEEIDGSWVIAVKTPFSNSLLSAIHTFVTSILTLILNIISLIILFGLNQKKSEMNLLMISCFDFILEFLLVVHQLWAYSFSFRGIYYDPVFDQLYLLYPWISDFANLSRPFLLLIMCKKLRVPFFSLWKSKIVATNRSIFIKSVSELRN